MKTSFKKSIRNLLLSVNLKNFPYTNLRCACSIELKEKVILTGGLKTLNKVTVYSSKGWVEDLPNLKTGRYYHGCGHFKRSDRKMVSDSL